MARFTGSLLLVSHDRAMLEAVGTRTVAVEDHKLRVFNGGWSEYREREAEQAEQERARASVPGTVPGTGVEAPRGKEARRARAQERAAVADVRKLENEIEAAEAALAELEEELSDPGCLVRRADRHEVDPPPRRGEREGQGADRALGSAQLSVGTRLTRGV